MEYTGLIQKFKVNRSLTEEERRLRLDQRKRLEIQPEHQLSVIRMDSTVLELVDLYFAWKGALTTVVVVASFLLVWMIGDMAHVTFTTPGRIDSDWPYLLPLGLLVLGALLFFGWVCHFECFRYTHYPLRFNRKTRKVHVFRTDATVLTADWDKLFFCLGRCYQQRHWTIQGHVLAADGTTVLETFSFPQPAFGEKERELLRHTWEFVRRYMDEGPAPLLAQTPVVLPIADKREGFRFGWHRTHAIWTLLLLPVYVLFYPGRWIAMRTSKIPRWPKEVDAQSGVAADDRCVRDASTNPSWAR